MFSGDGREGVSQPATSQPTILNIGPRPAPKGWNTVFVLFCDNRWVLWSLFCGALRLRWGRWAVRAESSHGKKSAKHASSRIWSPMLRQSCGASVLKHFENVSLNRRLLYIAWLHFEHFLGQSVGATHLKESFSRSFHFENLRSAIKHYSFEQKKLTLEGLPAGNWKRVQNRHMFRKQRILRMKIKTHSFAQFSCSSELNVQGYLQYNKDFA